MQILIFLAVALIGFTINFWWDRNVRRGRAWALTKARREARPRALPPPPAGDPHHPMTPSARVQDFVAHTRSTFAQLDQLIDTFDLLVLRAQARARFGMVTVNAERHREQACQLMDAWLLVEAEIDTQTRELLTQIGLAPIVVAGVVARERERAGWEFRADTAPVLEATILDLDCTVIHLQGVVRALERDTAPYR